MICLSIDIFLGSRVFLQVLQFFYLHRNQYSKFQSDLETVTGRVTSLIVRYYIIIIVIINDENLNYNLSTFDSYYGDKLFFVFRPEINQRGVKFQNVCFTEESQHAAVNKNEESSIKSQFENCLFCNQKVKHQPSSVL